MYKDEVATQLAKEDDTTFNTLMEIRQQNTLEI